MKYRLLRSDGLEKRSEKVMWLEWGEDSRVSKTHQEPLLETSLIMSPFNAFFTWQTTVITEILEKREDYVHFKTKNSEYELFIDTTC